MLHFTRALLAAAITLCIAPMLLLLWTIGGDLWAGGGLPDADRMKWLASEIQEMVVVFGILLLLIAVPMAVLWKLPSFRRWFQRSWGAAIAGMLSGMLVSPLWHMFARILLGEELSSWDHYKQAIVPILVLTSLCGAVSCFFHAFFVNRALAKKEWLAARREELSAGPGV